jgi:hypothetical protein
LNIHCAARDARRSEYADSCQRAAMPTVLAGRPLTPASGVRLPSDCTANALIPWVADVSAYRYWLFALKARSMGELLPPVKPV